MGFRFRRSIKLLPGVRINLGKTGVTVSAGVRGAHVTVGAKGTRTTVGVPGTGVSFTQYDRHGVKAPPTGDQRNAPEGRAVSAGSFIVALLVLALAALMFVAFSR